MSELKKVLGFHPPKIAPICKKHLTPKRHQKSHDVWWCQECNKERKKVNYSLKRDETLIKNAEWRAANRDSIREWRIRYNYNLKVKVFMHYGGGSIKCNNCDIDELHALALDHLNNNGNTHRKNERMSGIRLYFWLIKNEFPPGYQVLCHNCNILKRNARYEDAWNSRILTRKENTKRARNLQIKTEVLTHYGNGSLKCVQCGYSNLSALTIDHINNDGHLTRGVTNAGHPFYRGLKEKGFPEGYQTLCFNCNMIKEIDLHR